MAKLTNPEPLPQEVTHELEQIRSAHRLRALTDSESGSGVNRLPNGVYGFTYSPAEENFPLFNDRDLRSFEGHKLEDGSIFLLGFLTPEDKGAFEKTGPGPTIHLFPEPKGNAVQFVRVPLVRIVRHVENSVRKGTGLELLLRPA
jgi:hypothetical protein